jgi:methylase of polypeptide subunit release factors
MLEFKTEKGIVYYKEELDGGGTTFGVNCLKDPSVNRNIKKGDILEMCSGPGFMGFYLNFEGYADTLTLSDVNLENQKYIYQTIEKNNLTNTKFIHSDNFRSFDSEMMYDTIISNPPHFATPRPGGYKDSYQELISLDQDMSFHKNFFDFVGDHLKEDGRIILVENAGGISANDIIKICGDRFTVEVGEYNRYGWINDSLFYTVVIKKN